jgi:hypothetical protein
MRTLPACAFVALTSLAAACGGGGDAKPDAPPIVIPDAAPDAPPPPPDAQEFDFTCLNNTAPDTATATVTISGFANAVNLNGTQPSIDPLDEATVDACTGNCAGPNKLDTTTSAAAPCGANGCEFTTAALDTGGAPLDGFIRVAKTNFRTSNVFPAAPLVADQPNVPGLVFSNTAFQAATIFLGVTQSAANGNLGLLVTDCANTPITGATVTVTQNGSPAGGEIVDASSFGQGGGAFLVFDVPPGDTEVNAQFMGMTFRAHTVTTVAGQTTATQIRPGF